MKEIQMFPQITEEPEDNLINLEDDSQVPEKEPPSPASSQSSSSLFESVEEAPPSKDETPVPKIVAVDVDDSQPKPDTNHVPAAAEPDLAPPARVRMRSLSGGTYRLSPVPSLAGRMRRQSGDDVLTASSPTRRTAAAIFDAFRPRSKSDSKGKKPTFLATIRNSFFNSSSNNVEHQQRKSSLEQDYLDPLEPGSREYRQRSRSGSDTRGGTMSKMIDMFRNRSNSISIDQRKKDQNKKQPGTMQTMRNLSRRYSVDPARRRHHTMVPVQRSLELPFDCYKRDFRSETMQELARHEDPLVVPKFFDAHSCYDIIPKSGKVVVLDVHLEVEKAFHSLVGNTIRAAPLWDGQKMEFVGMLTISDFIDVLILYYSSEDRMKDLGEQTIFTWRKITNKPDNFIHIHPDASLTDAIKTLVHRQVHRLPVYDPTCQSVLFILTHKRILKYFCLVGLGRISKLSPQIFPPPDCLRKSLRELRIGTYENIATATLNMTVIEALKIFFERKVSALPVLEGNELINIYAKFDVLALANEQTYRNPHMTIREALEKRAESFEKVFTCTMEDSLMNVLDKIVHYEVHRLVIVSDENTVIGMVSLSDILKFLVLKPLGLLDEVSVSLLGEAEAADAACSSSSAPEIPPPSTGDDTDECTQSPELSDGKEVPEIPHSNSFD